MERRIAQNANDIVSIYDLLAGMDATLAKHTIQLSNVTSRLEAHDARFDGLDAGVAEILRRLPD